MLKKLLLLSFTFIAAPSYTIDAIIKDNVQNNIDFIFDNISTGIFRPNIDDLSINFMVFLATNPKADAFIDHATDNALKIIFLSPKEKQQLNILAKKYRKCLVDKTIEKIKEKVSKKDYSAKANRFNNLVSKFIVMFEQSASSIIPIDLPVKKIKKDEIESIIDFIFKVYCIAPAFKEGMVDIKDSIIKNWVNQVSESVAILATDSRMDSYIDNETGNLNEIITQSIALSPEEKLQDAIQSEKCGFQCASKAMEKIRKKLSHQDYNIKSDRIVILVNTLVTCYYHLAIQAS